MEYMGARRWPLPPERVEDRRESAALAAVWSARELTLTAFLLASSDDDSLLLGLLLLASPPIPGTRAPAAPPAAVAEALLLPWFTQRGTSAITMILL